MERVYIFDVDGTLTGSRQPMHGIFSDFFQNMISQVPVYLVTGSNLEKLQQQVPEQILNRVAGVFTCSGNELWQSGKRIFKKDHRFPAEMIAFVERLLRQSNYTIRTGRHVETRPGMLNVSVVGRNANLQQRNAYNRFDHEAGERRVIMARICEAFPEYEANQGGQISVDVSLKGWNKSRVHAHVQEKHGAAECYFFGDNIKKGGNDFPLAKAILDAGRGNRVFPVKCYDDTWEILQEHFAANVELASRVA